MSGPLLEREKVRFSLATTCRKRPLIRRIFVWSLMGGSAGLLAVLKINESKWNLDL